MFALQDHYINRKDVLILFKHFHISCSQLECTSVIRKEKKRLMYKTEKKNKLDVDSKPLWFSHAFVEMQHVVAGGTLVLHVFAGIDAEGDEAAGPASV